MAHKKLEKEEIKRRMQIPRGTMPEQDPQERIHNFNEVPKGLTPEMAQAEAERCILCKKPRCIAGCPVEIDIPTFIDLVAEGKFIEAARKIKEKNALPAVCGRVCPQDEQCEKVCTLGAKFEPVAIGRLERFVADYEREQGAVEIPAKAASTGKKIAVVGGGPGGLTVAGDMILKGHEVVVFEALHKVGGVLVYGIPEFRLPKAIVQSEVDYLAKLGVEFRTNYVIGKIETVEELMKEFDSVFIATGAGLPYFLNLPGENLNGIYSGNEFLTRANLMKAYDFPNFDTPLPRPKMVATVGGGNTAMDSARTALRLGPEKSYIVYRRSDVEMPARTEEIHHAKQEGVEFLMLTNPTRFIADDRGYVKQMEVIQMELGEPDASGRRRPVPKPGSEYILDVDMVIIATGNGSNPLIPDTTPGLTLNKWGNIVVDPATCKTSVEGVFAGGDIVRGGATVILAMGDGRQAANAMDDYVMGRVPW